MALLSTMVSLGSKITPFRLLEPKTGQYRMLEELKSDRGTVVMFICNHCPYVQHIQTELVKIASEYIDKGIAFIAINANDSEQYPADNPAQMKEIAEKFNYPFPYLFDETQEIASAYEAACTPDFFMYDSNDKLVYRGQFDDSRPKNNMPVTGRDLRQALDNLLAGRPISTDQKPSMGCSIKWKSTD